mmetsp:Transcript_8038/g.13369  ORF Transcript_8038/g.13369 Transcript_8038/m.13369 type:complete len:425 (-) Transcript_8038:138-1412(-)
MLSLSMWVYELGNSVKDMDENQVCYRFEDTNMSPDEAFFYGVDLVGVNVEMREAIQHILANPDRGRVVKFINDLTTGLQVAITYSPFTHRICVVFRGSDDEFDWMNNLKSFKTCLKDNIYVHSGFKEILDKHLPLLMTTIEFLLNLTSEAAEIYVCGHSLGGALATLFGFMLSQTATAGRRTDGGINSSSTENESENAYHSPDILVVSFASPRVGNSHWRTAFDRTPCLKHYRVTNYRDIITAVPNIFYHHTGEVIRLTPRGFQCCLNYAYPWWKFSLFNCWSIADHNISSYWRRLRAVHWKVTPDSTKEDFVVVNRDVLPPAVVDAVADDGDSQNSTEETGAAVHLPPEYTDQQQGTAEETPSGIEEDYVVPVDAETIGASDTQSSTDGIATTLPEYSERQRDTAVEEALGGIEIEIDKDYVV